MDNNLEKYATIDYKKSGNSVVLTVKIPAYNPRKKVPPLVFNMNDAQHYTALKYGTSEITVTALGGPTLENRTRTNVLEGEFHLKLLHSPSKPQNQKVQSSSEIRVAVTPQKRKRTRKTAKTTKTNNGN